MRILNITNSWDDVDNNYVHPRMKFLPPIVWDLFAVFVAVGLLYNLILYFSKITT